MFDLQRIFNKILRKELASAKIITEAVKRQLRGKGIILTDQQITEITKFIKNNKNINDLSIDLTEDQLKNVQNYNDSEKIVIELDDPENVINEIIQEIKLSVKESMPELIEEISNIILLEAKTTLQKTIKEHKTDRKDFEKRIYTRWKKAFDLLEMFIVISYEAGEEFNNNFRHQKRRQNRYLFDALTRLHARACQISSEILILLKSGYADGAHARWRTLHEIAVIGSFIFQYGNETAEKYLLHRNIEDFHFTVVYQQHCLSLGYEPLSQIEMESIRKTYDALIKRFGNEYKNKFGWAAKDLCIKSPTFAEIEKNLNLEHWRPYYKMASNNVHAEPKGILFKLGLVNNNEVLLAGPSNYGFADPAQDTAISLGTITKVLINSKPTIDSFVFSKILNDLEEDIGKEFLKVQKKIEKQEEMYK